MTDTQVVAQTEDEPKPPKLGEVIRYSGVGDYLAVVGLKHVINAETKHAELFLKFYDTRNSRMKPDYYAYTPGYVLHSRGMWSQAAENITRPCNNYKTAAPGVNYKLRDGIRTIRAVELELVGNKPHHLGLLFTDKSTAKYKPESDRLRTRRKPATAVAVETQAVSPN